MICFGVWFIFFSLWLCLGCYDLFICVVLWGLVVLKCCWGVRWEVCGCGGWKMGKGHANYMVIYRL